MATLVCGLLLPGSAAASSAPTPVNTSAPTLTGSPSPGQTLTCSPGSWSGNPSSFAYVWLRDGSPIAGQTGSAYSVQSADQGHALSCRVTATNGGGEYTIAGLASSSYQVYFQHPSGVILAGNYLPQYFDGQPTEQSANLVSVTTPNTVSGIDAQLQPGGQITGRVTSASAHTPLSSIEVCTSNSELLSFGSCATTDSAGDYTIVGLPSGSYAVGASVYGMNCMSVFKSACPEQNYLEGGLENVSVTASTTTSGANIELQPGGEVAGQVTDAATHAPLAKIYICASWDHREFVTSCTTTDAAGDYTLVALPSRPAYSITFTAQTCVEGQGCSRWNYLPQIIEPVSVTAPNTTSVDAQLQPGGQITGKVTDASTHSPLDNVSVCALEQPEKLEPKSNCASTNTAGEYTVIGLSSGTYDVSFHAEEYKEEHAYSVTVTAPNTTSGINAELQSQPEPRGKITGKITDANTGAPIAHISVCAGREASGYYDYGCPLTDAAGEYTFDKLPSGPYKLSFGGNNMLCFFTGESGCTEPNYLGQSVSAISVTAPNTSTVDAQLQPASQITGRVTDAATHTGLAGVAACAFSTSDRSLVGCAVTNGPGGAASATSNTLTITAAPASTAPNTAATTKPTPAIGGKHKAASNRKLAKALKACRKLPKRKRKKCEAQARRRYAPKRKSGTKHTKRKR